VGMQVQCPICLIIATRGTTKWFFDGGECRQLRGVEPGDAKAYERCEALSEAISKAARNVVTKAP